MSENKNTEVIKERVDMFGYMSCRNANPGGDPDNDNCPRQELDGMGIITDVNLKRRIRDYILLAHNKEPGYDMYVQRDDIALETKANGIINQVLNDTEMKPDELKKSPDRKQLLHKALANEYFDIRAFGGVISTYSKNKYSDGQITGPVQVSFAESLGPIDPVELSITRVSIQTEKDKEEKDNEIGKKYILPYGVYKFEVHITPAVAAKTGFTYGDLEILKEAIFNMYEVNYTASKTGMSVDKLFVFTHSSAMGNCRVAKLRSLLQETYNPDDKTYQVTAGQLPKGITLEVLED